MSNNLFKIYPEILKHHSRPYENFAASWGLNLADEVDTVLFQRNAHYPVF